MKKAVSIILLSIGISVLAAGCNTANNETSNDSNNNNSGSVEIELTKQTEGIFKGYEGDDFVIIEHEGKEESYSVKDNIVGDLDKVKEEEKIWFSYETMDDGTRVLQTFRIGE